MRIRVRRLQIMAGGRVDVMLGRVDGEDGAALAGVAVRTVRQRPAGCYLCRLDGRLGMAP